MLRFKRPPKVWCDMKTRSELTIDAGAKPSTGTWILTGQFHPHEPMRRIHIDCSPFRVGRSGSIALVIPRSTVSTAHAEFLVDGPNLRLRDLKSTNGTFVNGVRIDAEWRINHGDLIQFADVVFRAGWEALHESIGTVHDASADRALALIQFDQLMAERAVVPFYQPLVALDTIQTAGFEVLGRSRLFGLNEPKAMFQAAAVLNAQGELSRMFRLAGVREASLLGGTPQLFLNTHPVELAETELLELSVRELRDIRPDGKITLEIHEAAVTQPDQMRHLRIVLRDFNVGLAYDDFGAGQARLVELAEVPPDYLKFDLKLIRDIHTAPTHRQKVLESLVRMAHELGIVPVAEGVECKEEHEVCRQFGFILGQGFYYGRPVPAKHTPLVNCVAALDVATGASSSP